MVGDKIKQEKVEKEDNTKSCVYPRKNTKSCVYPRNITKSDVYHT